MRTPAQQRAAPQYVSSIEWPHGPLTRVMNDDEGSVRMGIRGMWIDGTGGDDRADDEHILPLEDDIEVSPLFYWCAEREGELQRA